MTETHPVNSAAEPLSALWRAIKNTARFLAFVARRFDNHGDQSTAAALAYTTLLALVPLFTLGFATLTAFPVFEALSTELQGFIFHNFVPASGAQVQAYLERFVTRASGLTLVGLVFLVVTSVALMSTIEQALNGIWQVNKRRHPVSAFLVYWAVLTLGPALLATSIAMSSYLLAAAGTLEAAAGLRLLLLKLTPTLATWAAFCLLYTLVPNSRVNLRHALAGAALAALLFEGAKKSFALYVAHFPGYETIYGALATLLLFQVWIYLCWLIILLGAEFAASLSHYQQQGEARTADATLYHALLVLNLLWNRQKEGGSTSRDQLLKQIDSVSDGELATLLDCLNSSHMVEQTGDNRWLLARNLDHLSLAEVESALPSRTLHLPPDRNVQAGGVEAGISAEIERLSQQRKEDGDLSVAALLQAQPAEAPPVLIKSNSSNS
ncbi:MAG: virulence factor BrkB family protein [Gammaproteobacteria bacterium]|nr:virulence factor BrkB family protein [Gammaproteobacteria bacterium]